MSSHVQYHCEIILRPAVPPAQAQRLQSRLYANTDLGSVLVEDYKESTVFVAEGGLPWRYIDAAKVLTKSIFQITGPCEVTYNYYYSDRDPDDAGYFDAEDYAKMIPPLEQLAQTSGDLVSTETDSRVDMKQERA